MEKKKNNKVNIQQFHLGEMFSSPTGKTSASLFCGVLMIITGCIGFFIGTVDNHSEILASSTAFAGLGATLLGIRRFTKQQGLLNIDNTEDDKIPTTTEEGTTKV